MTRAPDFTGYATRAGMLCSDGRTITPEAFEENDGAIVPLLWEHDGTSPLNTLGHVRLEKAGDGMRCHAYFNDTAHGQHAKELVRHGDVKFLSIFANQLKEQIKDRVKGLRDVLKGNIREVSLVRAGANPGATIDEQAYTHDDDGDFFVTDAIITTGIEIEPSLSHAAGDDDDNRNIADILATLDEDQETAVNFLLHKAMTLGADLEHSDSQPEVEAVTDPDPEAATDPEPAADPEVGTEPEADPDPEAAAGDPEANADPVDAGTDPTPEADADPVDASPDPTPEAGTDPDAGTEPEADPNPGDSTDPEAGDAVQHNTNQEDNSMTHNVFDQARNGGTLTHSQVKLGPDQIKKIVKNAKKNGSLKEALEDYLEHTGIEVGGTLQHGIENIDYLFPDAKTLENSPAFISRRMEWVDKVLSSVRKSPFSRIKTITADITPDEARARGYIKGNMKNEEFFALSKRETSPQTVYKKQKLDRDDVIDIVDLDVVAWLKAEMKVMLDEELAGAILVGDGRSIGDDDKIKESNIRPIATDAELYVTTVNVNLADANSTIEELVDAVIDNRQYYKGTGQPTFYTTEGTISKFLTVKDNFGRRIYSNLQEVAAVLRVTEIVPVEIMERDATLIGIMVNLADYTLGADRNGQATMFDDFDIDYNKLTYLIETRVSGALTQPKAALVFRSQAAANAELAQPVSPTFVDNVVTVPTVTNVTYKDADTDATLTTAAPVTLTEGDVLNVIAVPAAGYYFPNNAEDQWTFPYQA